MNAAEELLDLQSPAELEQWCGRYARDAIESFERSVPRALSGQWRALRQYVSTWEDLTDDLLHELSEVAPDLIVAHGGHLVLVDINRQPSPASRVLLARDSTVAPFSSWVAHSGAGVGTCAFLAERIREMLPVSGPILPEETALPHWDVDERDLRLFGRRVTQVLDGLAPPLERIREVLELNLTELGRIFGVRRQAVTQWLDGSVPAERRPKVATVAAIAEVLDHKLRPGASAAIVRRPAEAYGGHTALEMIRADRHEEVLDAVHAAFDWSTTE